MQKMVRKTSQVARQHNDFIVSPQSLSQNAFKFFIIAVSKIKTTDKELPEVLLSLKDFKDALPRSKDNIRFDFINALAKELMSNDGVVIKQGTKFLHIHFVDTILSDSKDGTFTIRFKQEMKPYLLELKHYTKSSVELICNFKSFYASRVYQILKMYQGKLQGQDADYSEVDLEISKIREMLDIPDSLYPDYAQLKRKVIEQAKTEINNNVLSDIKFSYSEIKGIGTKKVIGIKFQIHKSLLERIETAEIVSQEDDYRAKYNDELNSAIKELTKNITSNELNSIRKCAASLAKGLSDEEILEHNLFKAWVLMSKILPDKKRHLDSFEDWCIENKIEIQAL